MEYVAGAYRYVPFNRPRAVAAYFNGIVAVADTHHNKVSVIFPDGDIKRLPFDGDDSTPLTKWETELKKPAGLAVLQDYSLLVADEHRIRRVDPSLRHSYTAAGSCFAGFSDGDATFDANAVQFHSPSSLAVLPVPRHGGTDEILIADTGNHRIRVLIYERDKVHVKTVAGDGTIGNRDGDARHAQFIKPTHVTVLHDGRVLVADRNPGIRVISADLQTVSTLHIDGLEQPTAFAQLQDGRVLVATQSRIHVVAGL